MSWSVIIFFLCLITFGSLLEARDVKELPSAVVVGTVFCDTCSQRDFKETSHFISGASVAVECKGATSKPSFRKEVTTDDHGEFKVLLPFSAVRKHVEKVEGCSVKLISSSEPNCAVASTATSSSLHLQSRKQGTHIFSAGLFTFKPLKQPKLCNQKPNIQNSREQLGTEKVSLISPPSLLPTALPPLQSKPLFSFPQIFPPLIHFPPIFPLPRPPPPRSAGPFPFPFPPIFPLPRPPPPRSAAPFPFPPIFPLPRPPPRRSAAPFPFPPLTFPPFRFPSIPGIPPVSPPKQASP